MSDAADSTGAFESHQLRKSRAHGPRTQSPSARNPDSERRAAGERRQILDQARRRRGRRRPRDDLPCGPRVLRGVVRYRGPGARRWRDAPLEPLGNDQWRGSFTVDNPGRWVYTVGAWVDRIASWQDEVTPQDRRWADRARRRAVRGPRAPRRRYVARGDACRAERRPATTRSRSTPGSASTSTRRSRASARGTSCSRARGEGSRASRKCCRSSPSSGSTSSTCRRSIRSAGRTARAATTPSRRSAATSAARGRSAPRRAVTTRSIRISARRTTSSSSSRRRGELGIEIALDFAIQCSPDHPWLKEHPEWFHRRPDGTLKYAENPPKKLPGHLQRQLRVRRLARALGGAARRDAALGAKRRARVPRRQSAHEAGAVLGVADRRGAQGRAEPDPALGGVHPAGDDDDAREGRLLAVVHVLHVEEHEGGSSRS